MLPQIHRDLILGPNACNIFEISQDPHCWFPFHSEIPVEGTRAVSLPHTARWGEEEPKAS